eukprot:TRINITY_DN17999_c0_g1_i1.p1 TRINITY_DN17999_c0_g1~~TRINITY_DN17999_c0_g1_i1.p1  ORF type:complete len:281 (+),score=49.36 TRINITY_DN17999_c0_g1_i1:72-845(+)
MYRATNVRLVKNSGKKPSEYGTRHVPRWVKKTAVLWDSVEDTMRDKYLETVNNSKWANRFVQVNLMSAQKSSTNWSDQRGEVEPDEPCYKQSPLGYPDFSIGDKIWPIAMLNSNAIFLSVFVEKLTLVVIPGSPLEDLANEVRDQCLVPMAYWNPKTEVRPFKVPGVSVSTPSDVLPYWIINFVDGKEVVVPFAEGVESKYEVVQMLQERIAEEDTLDRKTWLAAVANIPDKNTWVRVKRHDLDDFTINEHCPIRYV